MSSADSVIVLEALKLLTTPSRDTGSGSQNEERDGNGPGTDDKNCRVFEFDRLLTRNLTVFDKKITTEANFEPLLSVWKQSESETYLPDKENPRWLFANYCVRLLNILSSCLQEVRQQDKDLKSENEQQSKHHSPSPAILSVNQQNTVLTAIQFIVCLGIGPCLHQGVGIPMELRSDLGKMVTISTQLSVSPQEKNFRLLYCVKTLLESIKVPSLGALVLSRHLADILACLLQLCYCQPKRVPPMGGNCLVSSQGLSQEDCLTPASVVDAVMKRNKQCRSSKVTCTGGINQSNPSKQACDTLREINSSASNYSSCNKNNSDVVDPDFSNTYTGVSVNGSGNTRSLGSKLGQSSSQESTIDDSTEKNMARSTEENINPVIITESDRHWCSESLSDLVDRVYQPMLVRELLLLQGGPSPQMIQKIHQQNVNRSVNSKPKLPVLSPAPPWLRRGCGQLLTQILLKPHGVQHVLRGMLDVPTGNTVPGDLDWKRCEAVARVIANCPKQVSSVEVYYKLICPQVLELLHSDDRQLYRQFSRVGCSVVNMMTSQKPDLADICLLQPLLEPLNICLISPVGECAESEVIVNEVRMSQCLEDLHKMLVSTLEPPPRLFTSVNTLLQPIFKLYCFLKHGVSHLRNAVQEILVTVLRSQDNVLGVASLELCLFETFIQNGKDRLMAPGVVFAAGPTGGVVLVSARHSLWYDSRYPQTPLKPLGSSRVYAHFTFVQNF